jgi:hypothetical protein
MNAVRAPVYVKPLRDSSNDIGFCPSLEVVSRRMHMGPTCQGVVMISILVLTFQWCGNFSFEDTVRET